MDSILGFIVAFPYTLSLQIATETYRILKP